MVPLATEVECIQLRSRVTSLESKLVDLTQRFIVLGQTNDKEKAIVEANCAKASSRVDDLVLRLLEARSFIHSTLRLEYGLADEPSKPQLAFRRLQAKVTEREEALRVAIAEVGTLQALLDTERQCCISSPDMERELICLQHSYGRFREIARYLGFDAAGVLCTHSSDDLIFHTGFGVLCREVSDCLGHI